LDDIKLKEDLKLIIKQEKNENKKNNIINDDDNNLKSDFSKDEESYDGDISLINNLSFELTESKDEKLSQEKYLDLFMTALSTCHSGIINEKEFDNEKKLIYQASSPDEIAILNFARKYNYIFFGRKDNNKIIIEKPDISQNNLSNKKIIYKVHIRFEYSSERKSMSIIVQNTSNPNEIFLFMKGADDVILSKIDKKNKNNKNILKNIKNYVEAY
jgi:magnesium-transporting ATPase (P-type)